jgi:hypothetical protein
MTMSPVSLGACGKERSGFPQVGGADLSEIPHPVDPEIWKRHYYVCSGLIVAFLGPDGATRTALEMLPLPWLLPGEECSKGLTSPQGTRSPDEVIVGIS